MRYYLFKRIMEIIPVLFIITFIVFILVYVAGDPITTMLPPDATPEQVAILKESLGLNQSFLAQYWTFMKNLFQGDFGTSYRYNEAALPIVLERLPATFELAFASFVVATIVSIPLGIWSATRRNSFLDLFITGFAVLGKAIPSFWLGIMMILLFGVTFQIFPISGRGTLMHLILPAIALGTASAAEMTRLIRSSMLDILYQDFIRTAKSKGLKDYLIVYKHAFRNALNPVISITFLQISFLISGSIVVETVFSWPGIGQLLIQAVNTNDMALVQASVFVIAILVIGLNLIADVLYRVLDPRINY